MHLVDFFLSINIPISPFSAKKSAMKLIEVQECEVREIYQ